MVTSLILGVMRQQNDQSFTVRDLVSRFLKGKDLSSGVSIQFLPAVNDSNSLPSELELTSIDYEGEPSLPERGVVALNLRPTPAKVLELTVRQLSLVGIGPEVTDLCPVEDLRVRINQGCLHIDGDLEGRVYRGVSSSGKLVVVTTDRFFIKGLGLSPHLVPRGESRVRLSSGVGGRIV